MLRVVILTTIKDGQPMVAGVFGPYEDGMAASDAVGSIRGIELPEGVELMIGQCRLEDPAALAGRIQDFAAASPRTGDAD